MIEFPLESRQRLNENSSPREVKTTRVCCTLIGAREINDVSYFRVRLLVRQTRIADCIFPVQSLRGGRCEWNHLADHGIDSSNFNCELDEPIAIHGIRWIHEGERDKRGESIFGVNYFSFFERRIYCGMRLLDVSPFRPRKGNPGREKSK